ncbi:PREDICTED: uncharacterized protein LOC104600567 isoform X2 [Nelumbo nucifera]|uniref:Uncharacterized protein LOC104600567 isoform X2 n=1 Tax=Nelumbo nucifera TaxID=4432 RepID=A0A1U8AID1_NELNU|nr:PREDICTED: uncharacterized protein LOC104600567 isoform X2 [Nelumbo nucifera]
MSMALLFRRPVFLKNAHHGFRNHCLSHATPVSVTMKITPVASQTRERGKLSISEVHTPSATQLHTACSSGLRFDRLPSSNQECDRGQSQMMEFGEFVVREAFLDEEYWTAAWLRAESHWEGRPIERYVDNYKRKYTEQEFNALKRRCSGQHAHECICLVAVKKEERNVQRTVVGTLDLNIQEALQGEMHPGEPVKALILSRINRGRPCKYGYIANLCVAKFARRQGIASNMLYFAIESAKSNGVANIFVHVHGDNLPAWALYHKMGFQVVEKESSRWLEDQIYLLWLKT